MKLRIRFIIKNIYIIIVSHNFLLSWFYLLFCILNKNAWYIRHTLYDKWTSSTFPKLVVSDWLYMSKSAKPSQFLCHETGKNFFFKAHLSDTFFLNLYTLYYTRKQLNKRKRVCDIVLGKTPFFLWEFNMGKMDEK